MLADALKELKTFILEQNGDNESDEVILEKLQTLEKKHNVPKNANLSDYLFYFTELKLALIEKGLRKEDGTYSRTTSKDWLPAEKKICWYFINTARNEEKLKITDALSLCAEILSKTENGVRAKFYEMESAVKKGGNIEEEFVKGRGGKVVQLPSNKETEESKQAPEQETGKQPEKATDEPEKSKISKMKKKDPGILKREEKNEKASEKRFFTKNELVQSSPNISLEDETNIGKTLNGIIRNLVSLTKNTANHPDVIEPIDRVEIANFFIGFEKFLDYGKKYTELLPQTKELEKQIEALKSELKAEKELTESLHKEIKKLEDATEKRLEKYEEIYNHIQKIHTNFISKDELDQLQYIPEYQKSMKFSLEQFDKLIKEEKEELLKKKDKKYLVNTRNGLVEALI